MNIIQESEWRLDGFGIIRSKYGRPVCQMLGVDGRGASRDGLEFYDKQDKLNADLLRAAPDLLAQLEEIKCWLTAPDLSPGVIAAYRHDCEIAIAKAKGTK